MYICEKLGGILLLAGLSVAGTPSPSAQSPPYSRCSSALSLHTQCPATPERALPTPPRQPPTTPPTQSTVLLSHPPYLP